MWWPAEAGYQAAQERDWVEIGAVALFLVAMVVLVIWIARPGRRDR